MHCILVAQVLVQTHVGIPVSTETEGHRAFGLEHCTRARKQKTVLRYSVFVYELTTMPIATKSGSERNGLISTFHLNLL